MPVVRKKWKDISVDEQRNYQDEESFDMYWDELEAEALELLGKVSREEFDKAMADAGIEWVDD